MTLIQVAGIWLLGALGFGCLAGPLLNRLGKQYAPVASPAEVHHD